ncbi:ubiquitin carboxyl-terminal hydrolase, partial [Haematococcus lacustris]
MNSVLQCLTHTPPLAQAVLGGAIKEVAADDVLTATACHIKRALSTTQVVAPRRHAQTLRQINKRFRLGRQEDSHEYLRCLLDAMQEACLQPYKPKPSQELAETTVINRIFGGKLRSRIKCHDVSYESSIYEDFMDLSLEVAR